MITPTDLKSERERDRKIQRDMKREREKKSKETF